MRRRNAVWAAGGFIALAALAFIGLGLGRYGMSPGEALAVLLPGLFSDVEVTPLMRNVVLNIRLPRILLAMLCGAGLSAAGAAFQGLFANPLATPDTLGVATGASFGAALGILMGWNLAGVQLIALAAGLAAVALVYAVSGQRGGAIMLILGGMAVGALFSAGLALVKYVADPQDVLPNITYWLMGSLNGASWPRLMLGAPFILIGGGMIFALRWRLNALSLDAQEAQALGVNVRRVRALLVLAGAMVTAAAVSMCGQIGWVGLLVPHAARLAFGSYNRRVVPASLGFGAIYLLAVDTLARLSPAGEIPVSILTAAIGAPAFIVLLRRMGGTRR